ncbi:MAG: permease, partial [Spirochaetes bacterium]|nr:permease [Spirochaetota bacterium]
PVIHRLLKKKVPLYICITFLFSAPIVNILVIISTSFAFNDYYYIVLLRILGGFFISLIAGIVVDFSFTTKDIVKADFSATSIEPNCNCNCQCSCEKTSNPVEKIKSIISHSIDEFFDTGKYFILGIIITALIQSVVPRNNLADFGNSFPLSNFFMIGFPYLLSNCSNTDAFIARSFMGQFSVSSISTFMIFGAMFDIKTTIMLKKLFKPSFIIRLLLLIISLNLLFSFIIEFFLKV